MNALIAALSGLVFGIGMLHDRLHDRALTRPA